MTALPIAACTAISAIGRGRAAMLASLRDRRTGLRRCDFTGITRGYVGAVDAADTHRLPARLAAYECRNNRLADLALHTDGFAQTVARARDRYGPARIAVVLGTSTSGVLAGEDAYAARDADGALPAGFDHRHTQDLGSLAAFVRDALGLAGPSLVVSVACASAARAVIDATNLIRAGFCDAAVVGGADSLCRMTLRGFAALDLVSDTPCSPCDAARGGVSIGEAAGFALLDPGADAPFAVLGGGASSDGHHMSAPDPDGAGAIAAMRAALDSAGLRPDDIDLINLHGTGTRANDRMEDRAVSAVFGDRVPCSSTKGWTGHTLGACGILELVIATLCIEHGLSPGCVGVQQVDPQFGASVLVDNRHGPIRRVLSNSFGFGGANAALVVGAAV